MLRTDNLRPWFPPLTAQHRHTPSRIGFQRTKYLGLGSRTFLKNRFLHHLKANRSLMGAPELSRIVVFFKNSRKTVNLCFFLVFSLNSTRVQRHQHQLA